MQDTRNVENTNVEKMQLHHDEALLEQVRQGTIPWAYRSWQPAGLAVVLGRGNSPSVEVHEERCREERVPVVRRRGGGGTVLLYPGILVISLIKRVAHYYQFKHYFEHVNGYIIEALEGLGIADLNQQGHSDVCIGNRKILGSSMYRSKTILFYTASLMVSNELDVIDRYVKHPSQEPDYRKGRRHQEFLTTVTREYPQMTFDAVQQAVDTLFPKRIPELE